MAGIWCSLLGVERVGVEESFFELGGHSLLGIRLISRVRETFGVELAVRTLFESPTLAALAGAVERELHRGVRAGWPPIGPVPRDAPLPLSFAQERLWFLDQLEPGGVTYNVPAALRLSGALDLEALRASLTEVVRRHESLRTTFEEVLGSPVQRIEPAREVGLPEVDLRGLTAAARELEVGRLTAAEAARPFSLAAGPLLRATALRLTGGAGDGVGEWGLLFTLHHIVSDAWSAEILVRELGALYGAYCTGRPSPRPAGSAGHGGSAGLPELPVQYADFAVWQRQWLSGEVLEEQLAYWRAELAGAPMVLQLPADRPRPAVQTFRGWTEPIALPHEVSAALRSLARQSGATLFMTLLAAFDALLGRTTGQVDLLVGSPIANRSRREVEGLIGFFVNTLVLRGRLTGEPSFGELAERVRSTALGAYGHQDLPFERLVEALQVPRSLSYSPLFQVMFVLQHARPPLALPGLEVSGLTRQGVTAKWDLNLSLVDSAESITGSCEYSTDLFEPVTVRRLLAHFETLLEGIVAAPERRLSELPLMAPSERQQLTLEWNDTGSELPQSGDLAARVVGWAERSPDAPAVVFGPESLSYRELDRRSNGLARRLIRSGVGPDRIVAICAERSLEMAVAVLAVLKAGGAYMPLDPTYPSERLSFLLADSGAPVLLTQARLLASQPVRFASYDGSVIYLEEPSESDDAAPACQAAPENLAYVLFTSGSTGRPKGVAMSRGALANLLSWQERGVLREGARTLQFASLSFDVSFQELLSTWWTGGTLVLVSEETRRDPQALLALLAQERVERVFLPFVALRHLAEAAAGSGEGAALPAAGASAHGPLALRDVVTAGEQLQVTPAVAAWLSGLPGARLHNQYGPTEAHVVTALTLAGDPRAWPALPSI
ncbi:MAG TPA: condensation domain-containing protein, partial [Thermoanaerobaculia bacterium]